MRVNPIASENLCMRPIIVWICLSFFARGPSAFAETQTWDDNGSDNVWSTNSANWDAGAVWTNGNSAVFSGNGGTQAGETVDVSATVTVANVTFSTNGYVVADADHDGLFSFVGGPSEILIGHAGDTAIISTAISGGGFTKEGPGSLQLTGTNTFVGVATVNAGILKLNPNTPDVLGATGTGNETVVADGATLDFNGCYARDSNNFFNRDEDFVVSGSGVNGIGALINTGLSIVNNGFRGLRLTGNTVIGGSGRIDLRGTAVYSGNGYTLTKNGSFEMAVSCPVTNSPIIINAGTYTIQSDAALGGTDYPTTLNGGKLMSWGTHTLSDHLIVNGGTISVNASGLYTFKLTGNMTLNSNAVVQTEGSPTNTVELSGVLDGVSGFTCNGSGFICVSGGANTYSGPTTVNSGSHLLVGKTVGGTGVLGSGAVTNNGTLYANTVVLGTGPVVNNNSGVLYLNPPALSVGRIVNQSGTVYGTSVVQAASGVVNASTWNSYSGSFVASAVTNASGGTLNLYTNQLVYGQFVNGGTLSLRQSITLADPMTFIGGTVYVNDLSNTLYMTGPVTLAGNASFSGTASSVTEISGALTGPGGIIRSGDGLCTITGTNNDYTGPTVVNSGKSLYVGKAGWMGDGVLGSGAITNQGNLYFDSSSACSIVGGLNGGGNSFVRYGGQLTFNGGFSSNSVFRVGDGSLTLTNGAVFAVYTEMSVADRQNVGYTTAPANSLLVSNVTASVTVNDGCALIAKSITFGNGGSLSVGGAMTGILNQVGGVVRTTGSTAEDNGVRLGHYPQTYSIYNMMGGLLVVENNWDLGCATDGQGWFNMTGGEVYTKRVMLNERDNAIMPGGYGRFTLSGGTLLVGSLTGSDVALSNGICADPSAPYLVELGGGAGGTIRAVTNLWIPATATLYGSGTNAVTLDSDAWTITMTNRLSGSGGFNKAGTGSLLLSGNNVFTGLTQVVSGTLLLGSAAALSNAVPLAVASRATVDLGGFSVRVAALSGEGAVSNGSLTVTGAISPGTNSVGELTLALASAAPGGTLVAEVGTNGVSDVLHATGDLSLEGMSLQVVDNGKLDRHATYTVVRADGHLRGLFASVSLPAPWYVCYDWSANRVKLSAAVGTVISLR